MALILTEDDLRRTVGMDTACLDAVAEAFTWLETGRAQMPPIMHVEVTGAGDVDVKSASVEGVPALAVKIAGGFFGNAALGLSNSPAMMVVLSAQTGHCEAVLLDNGYLTDLRTGLAGAVAARHLAPETVSTVGVLGCGTQARYQVHALALVRRFERLLVAGRDGANQQAYVEEMSAALGVEVRAAPVAEVVSACDVLVTTTPSRQPLVEARWLHRGQHVTAMGSDLPGKAEIEPAALRAVDRLICDRRAQCLAVGELRQLADDPAFREEAVTELGAITSGRSPGRTSDAELTLCDLTGTGVQDTAIAVRALAAAREQGLGREIGA